MNISIADQIYGMRFAGPLLLLAVVVIATIFSAGYSAAEVNNATTVNVSVLPISSLVITPINLTWMTLAPGNTNFTYNIVTRNTGTVALTNFYVTPSTLSEETANPLGGTDASAFSSAGFLSVRNSSNTTSVVAASPKHFHVGRVEWNLSDLITDEVLDLATDTSLFGHGWYRNATGNEFMWKVENGTDGWCNETDTIIVIKDDPENSSSQSRDFTKGTILGVGSGITAGGENINWSTFHVTSGELTDYCIAVNASCDFIYLYKYDMSGPTERPFPACPGSSYLRSAALNPGQEYTMSVYASMPMGVPAGQTAISRLVITAT